MKPIRRRIKKIMLAMCEGQDYYKESSPVITQKDINEIQEITGELLQIEKLYGAERGSPTVVYPLRTEKFKEAVRRLGYEFRI